MSQETALSRQITGKPPVILTLFVCRQGSPQPERKPPGFLGSLGGIRCWLWRVLGTDRTSYEALLVHAPSQAQ